MRKDIQRVNRKMIALRKETAGKSSEWKICSKLVRLYFAIADPDLKMLCVEAIDDARRMGNKLKFNKTMKDTLVESADVFNEAYKSNVFDEAYKVAKKFRRLSKKYDKEKG